MRDDWINLREMQHKDKTLILIRHGSRDLSTREPAANLNSQGKKQSLELITHFEERYRLTQVRLISSPKARCIETLGPLSHHIPSPIEIQALLDEQHPDELFVKFHERIQKFIQNWKASSDPITIACTHGDWIPIASEWMTSQSLDLATGEWAEFSLKRGKPYLSYLKSK